ncbi:hypothetical protein CAOG_00781 [Capsaspora owczarzaki ATCC 30864]|uniref:protein-histidine N-methyltransferase n=1 Tax=Capsaspora owczarzaki (strain ATCC 30864) TaxID=595528 RepID=A0A0D2WHV5_CAPO3|nr:hypothetical protein CAOG_00781 [Capsaspora owczarzaki ATCC 30864]KJE89280.1 hypothetical protein CAOG_000781 [Capsaspora owczarzaki ATCC 30864]|eukprot:XP_004365652.1 hypothetical protein CAOG_00781 [Capsaspora owczarzaki ATCC 30864]
MTSASFRFNFAATDQSDNSDDTELDAQPGDFFQAAVQAQNGTVGAVQLTSNEAFSRLSAEDQAQLSAVPHALAERALELMQSMNVGVALALAIATPSFAQSEPDAAPKFASPHHGMHSRENRGGLFDEYATSGSSPARRAAQFADAVTISADPGDAALERRPYIEHAVTQLDLATAAECSRAAIQVCDGTLELMFKTATAIEMEFKQAGEEQALVRAIDENMDVVPAVYEGGLKVWEASLDLLAYLHLHPPVIFRDHLVLELGCGTALPGIYALKSGASVMFQDYNAEVIQHVTIPNVLLNADLEGMDPSRYRFSSGDWRYLPGALQGAAFDVILSAETIYSPANYNALITAIRSCMKKPSGLALLASKTYYFGVGGGTREFMYEIQTNHPDLQCQVVFAHDDGVKREILSVSWSGAAPNPLLQSHSSSSSSAAAPEEYAMQ